MPINLISTASIIKVGPRKGQRMFTTRIAHYSTIQADEALAIASANCLLPQGILRAAWEAIGSLVSDYVLNGHIIEIPGIGHIRAEIRARAQEDAATLSPDNITHRKLMLTPCTKLRRALNETTMSYVPRPLPDEPIEPEESAEDTDNDTITPEPPITTAEAPAPEPLSPIDTSDTTGDEDTVAEPLAPTPAAAAKIAPPQPTADAQSANSAAALLRGGDSVQNDSDNVSGDSDKRQNERGCISSESDSMSGDSSGGQRDSDTTQDDNIIQFPTLSLTAASPTLLYNNSDQPTETLSRLVAMKNLCARYLSRVGLDLLLGRHNAV